MKKREPFSLEINILNQRIGGDQQTFSGYPVTRISGYPENRRIIPDSDNCFWAPGFAPGNAVNQSEFAQLREFHSLVIIITWISRLAISKK